MGPHAAQARIQVLVLGEPHLKAAFATRGVEGEDVEDEGRPVDDLDVLVDDLLEVGLLRGAQLVVEDDKVGGVGAGELRDLLGFAGADERARIGGVELLGGDRHRVRPGGIREALQFRKRGGDGPLGARAIHADQDGALALLLDHRRRAPLDH